MAKSTSLISSVTNYNHRTISGIEVVALDRHGGISEGNFSTLNLGGHVGDNPAAVNHNIQVAAQLVLTNNVAVLHAEHGNVVHRVSKISGIRQLPLGDGAVTNEPGVALLALAADCVAGCIVDPLNKVIGVFHAGWKGVLAQVVSATWSEMKKLGATNKTAQAFLGPAICANCYEVPTDRVELFRSTQPQCAVDDHHLDINAGIRAQLSALGIYSETFAGCTYESDNLFSYRRANGQPTGRGGLIVCMPQSAKA